MMKGTFALFFICFSFFVVSIFLSSILLRLMQGVRNHIACYLYISFYWVVVMKHVERETTALSAIKVFFSSVCCFSTQPTMNFSQFYFLFDRWFFVFFFFFFPFHSKFHFYYVTYNIWMECPWIWTCSIKMGSGFLL